MARLITLLTLAGLTAASAVAQDETDDLTLPPDISSEPGEVRLEPAPEDREDVLEVVVTAGQSEWRLPDLGSDMRSEQENRDANERIDVTFLYLYDPERQDPTEELFPDDSNPRSVGFLQVFEMRFGKQPE